MKIITLQVAKETELEYVGGTMGMGKNIRLENPRWDDRREFPSAYSRSKRNSSRNRKQGKVVRIKGEFKQYDEAYMVDEFEVGLADQEAAQREYDLFTKIDYIANAKGAVRSARASNLTSERLENVVEQVTVHILEAVDLGYVTDRQYGEFREWASHAVLRACQLCHAPVDRYTSSETLCRPCVSELRGE